MAQISIFAVQFNVKTYNYNNGLISGSNNFTYQSVDGFYWICSFGGLVRFDGENFKSFRNSDGLTNYRVNGFFEESNNKYLICNEYALLLFDGFLFKKIHTNLPINTIYYKLIRLTDKTILLQTNNGCYKKINDSTYSRFAINNQTIDLISEFQNNRFITLNIEKKSVSIFENNKQISCVKIPDNIILHNFISFYNQPLISTNNGIYTIQNNQLKLFIPEKFTSNKKINTIFRDSKNRIWVTDQKNELWIYDGNNWENQTLKYKTKEQPLATIFEDKNNNICVTALLGITIYRESYFNYIAIDAINNTDYNYRVILYNKDTQCIGVNKNGLLLVHNNKVFAKKINVSTACLDTKTIPCLIYKNENQKTTIIQIRRNGIYKIENNKLIPFCYQKTDFSTIGNGTYDSVRNCFYAGNNNNLYVFYPSKIDTFNFSKLAPNLNPHSFIIMDDGSLLFIATHQRLIQFKNNKLIDITGDLNLKNKDFFILKNKNIFWVCLLGIELRTYSYANNRFKLQKIISQNNGLLDANIADIKFDDENNLWMN